MKTCWKYTLIAVFCFFLVYFAVTPFYLKKEIMLEPVWIQDTITADISEYNDQVKLYPFKSQNRFGYFDTNGSIYLSKDMTAKASITDLYWCTYDSLQEETTVYKKDGSIQCTITQPGFAFLTDYRFYIFMPGGDAVATYDTTGKLLWVRESVFPITAFNTSEFGTVIGYADGSIVVIDDHGVDSGKFSPAGSTHNVILGLDLSKDGTLLACVSGIDKQRFVLTQLSNGQFKIIYHTYLPDNERRQLFVRIDEKKHAVYYEFSDSLGVFNIETKETTIFPRKGFVSSIKSDPDSQYTFILEKSEMQYTLSVLENMKRIAETSFNATDSFIIQDKNDVFLGKDNTVARIKINEK